MVAAGVFLIARIYPVFEPLVLDVMVWIGAFTAFMAATIALTQNDIKRILAYSTISQIGYMLVGLAVATPMALAGSVLLVMIVDALTLPRRGRITGRRGDNGCNGNAPVLPAREERVGTDPLVGSSRLLAVLERLIADGGLREQRHGGTTAGRRVQSHDQKVLRPDHGPVTFGTKHGIGLTTAKGAQRGRVQLDDEPRGDFFKREWHGG